MTLKMYHTYENKACITGRQFIGLFSFSTYRNAVKNEYFVKHGRGGNGREVYIEVETIKRPDIKAKIIDTLGPVEAAAKTKLANEIVVNDTVRNELKAYRYFLGDKETSLPEGVQVQYCNESAIFDMMKRTWDGMVKARQSKGKKPSKKDFIQNAYDVAHSETVKKDFPHKLPDNVRFFENKYKKYIESDYTVLISGKYGNKNTEKINEDAKMWLLATWVNPVERVTGEKHLFELYNEKAKAEGWKKLKSSQALHNFLFEPEIEKLWYGHRYGELKSKEKFTLFNSTKMPLLRDALWYSDGTKLNYFYSTENGEMKTTSVYEVMDVSSEFMLGFHISDTENFEAQYKAYRMALQTAGHKPYEVVYDNQGGHKKLENGDFLKKLAHLSIRTKPYNGKSKTIELAFGRFQQEFLKRDWFFSGQNIQAKKEESKANMEFILANKMNLKTLAEIKQIYEMRRNQWNNAPHPTSGKSRIETYFSTVNDKAPALQIFDMVDLFWITRPVPVTYAAYGLTFTEAKIDYTYIKYTAPLQPDFDFHFDNIGRKFMVKFDPADMSMIYVYEQDTAGQLRFVTEMNTKVKVFRDKQEQEDWEPAYIQHINQRNDEKRSETWHAMEDVLRQQGVHAEDYGLISPHIKGVDAPAKKGERQAKAQKVKQTADWNKAVSNAVLVGNDEQIDELLDIYKLM